MVPGESDQVMFPRLSGTTIGRTISTLRASPCLVVSGESGDEISVQVEEIFISRCFHLV